ncbi:MAG: hypothetical protein K1W16_04660 [Lachnospiraceae bacterium]
MEKKLLAEVEGCHIRQVSSIDHYAIVKLKIYTIDADVVLFENHCSFERLPEKFVIGVEKAVQDYASKYNLSGIEVCLLDGNYHQYDSSEMDFNIATLKALFELFQPKKEKDIGKFA